MARGIPLGRLTAWMDRAPGIHFIERRPMPPLGHFRWFAMARRQTRRGISQQQPAKEDDMNETPSI